jgi:hypothetical protein
MDFFQVEVAFDPLLGHFDQKFCEDSEYHIFFLIGEFISEIEHEYMFENIFFLNPEKNLRNSFTFLGDSMVLPRKFIFRPTFFIKR